MNDAWSKALCSQNFYSMLDWEKEYNVGQISSGETTFIKYNSYIFDYQRFNFESLC